MAKQRKQPAPKTGKPDAAPPAAIAATADVAREPLDYRLILHAGDLGRATLQSPRLDPLMHPQGTAPVIVMQYMHDSDRQEGASVVDAFQIESVLDYLRHQAVVRATLEREVPANFATSEPSAKVPKGPAMWRKVTVYDVYFNRKTVITRARFKAMQRAFPNLNDSAFAGMAAGADRPETRSSFQVFVRGPWQNEHAHYAQFRDGKFVEFTIQ